MVDNSSETLPILEAKNEKYGNHGNIFPFFFFNSTFLRLQHMDIPSANVLVSALMTLLARSLRPNDVLSCSTETISDPESFFLISRSVVGCQEKNNEVKQ